MSHALAPGTTDRPRIALIAPDQGMASGQGAQAATLAAKLRRDGFEVAVLPIDPPLGLSSLRLIRAADVLHICAAFDRPFLSAASLILLAKRWGKRVVVSYYKGDADDHAKALGPWMKRVDDLVVPSPSFQRIVAEHGHRVRVIPPIVDVCRFQYRKRARLGPYFLSTRSLNSEHDLENTLLAFALVRTRYDGATLTIAGTGSEANNLRQFSKSLGSRFIRFLGRVEPSEMPCLYEEADIYLNSSLTEHQPTAVLEAMASGLPVISTDCGDLPLLVQDGITGLLVSPHDPSSMAKAATVLLEREGFAQQIGYGAKERLDRYTWSHVREAWASVYAGPSVLSPARMTHSAHGTSHAA